MKKQLSYILAMLLLGSSMASYGQRILPGQMSVQADFGSMFGHYPFANRQLGIGITQNKENGNYALWRISYANRFSDYHQLKIPIRAYIAEGGYSFFITGDTPRNLTVNGGITAFGGYNKINGGNYRLLDGATIISHGGVIYGAAAIFSLDAYLSDRMVLLLQGRSWLGLGKSLPRFGNAANLGIRFTIFK